MAVLFNCFSSLFRRKKKDQGDKESTDYKTLQVKLEHTVISSKTNELKSTSYSVSVPYATTGNTMCKVKVMSHEHPVTLFEGEVAQTAYEAEDEHDEYASFKRDISDLDLQANEANSGEDDFEIQNRKSTFPDTVYTDGNEISEYKNEKGTKNFLIQSGHVSDPGIGKPKIWASPKLKRSCSNLETRGVLKKPSKSRSFAELQELAVCFREDVGNPGSPGSLRTHGSADGVMLKKHSSAQILPSRSRKLWWKLFLWSHRSLRNTYMETQVPILITSNAFNQQGGYSSDTGEPNRVRELKIMESPRSYSGESTNNDIKLKQSDNQSLNSFHGADSDFLPQNQCVAFTTESSSFDRVDGWVKDLGIPLTISANREENVDMGIVFPPSPGRSPSRTAIERTRHSNTNLSEEIIHANSVIRSLNSSSNVAHIAGIDLKVIPSISSFCSLRTVNLSNNVIARISPGSLPKGLHTLNLSKNKINTIEGLRELTRLRVLDLSYNRISRIGQGLSNCTLIKELYLAGNKISDVGGLHRLLKLTVLELSFNKITTKGLGQLIANYNSLLALNLLGNPIQTDINEEQLRKSISGLLPKLAYLNKQPIKPQRAREVPTDNVARTSFGNSSWSSRRKFSKRVSQVSGASSSTVHRSRGTSTTGHGSRHRSKSRTHH